MTFQLVRASDDSIAVWQIEHGHIYVYAATPDRMTLTPVVMRDAPDALQPAQTFADDALRFATDEARVRQIIEPSVKRGRTSRRSRALA